jgi:hypothetical protein
MHARANVERNVNYDADEVLEFGTGETGTAEQILVSVAVDYKLGVEGAQIDRMIG